MRLWVRVALWAAVVAAFVVVGALLRDWEGWRGLNATAALTSFALYVSNTAGLWDVWTRSERRVSVSVCSLLFVLAYGSIEAWLNGNDVLLSTITLSAVLTALAGALADDRRTRHDRT